MVIISGHGNIETAVTAIKRGATTTSRSRYKADRLILVTMRALETYNCVARSGSSRSARPQSAEMIGRSTAVNQLRRPARAGPRRPTAASCFVVPPVPARSLRRVCCIPSRAALRAVRRSERRGHVPDRVEEELVRHRGPDRGTTQSGGSRRGTRGHAKHRRGGRHALETQGKILRVLVEQNSCCSAAARRCRSTCASSPRRAATWSARWAMAASSRGPISSDQPSCRSGCRGLRSGGRTSPELVTYFVQQIAQSSGLSPRRIGEDALAVLQPMNWPGNVRELRNNIERLMILCGGDPDAIINADMLPDEIGLQWPLPVNGGAEHLMSLPQLRGARDLRARVPAAQINRSGEISRARRSSSAWNAPRSTAS